VNLLRKPHNLASVGALRAQISTDRQPWRVMRSQKLATRWNSQVVHSHSARVREDPVGIIRERIHGVQGLLEMKDTHLPRAVLCSEDSPTVGDACS
jgi:hypothetical protein